MLILTRKPSQRILLNNGEIALTFLGYEHGQLKIGIDAPKRINIIREEIRSRYLSQEENLCVDQHLKNHSNQKVLSLKRPLKKRITNNE